MPTGIGSHDMACGIDRICVLYVRCCGRLALQALACAGFAVWWCSRDIGSSRFVGSCQRGIMFAGRYYTNSAVKEAWQVAAWG